jgi:hypothetical protein
LSTLSQAAPFQPPALPWKPIVALSAVGLKKVVLTLLADSREANDSLNEDNLGGNIHYFLTSKSNCKVIKNSAQNKMLVRLKISRFKV